MKKIFTLLFILAGLFVSGKSFAQALSMEPNDTLDLSLSVSDTTMELILKGGVINNTDSMIELSWSIRTISAPSTWVTSYCDDNACIDISLLSASSYNLASHDTGLSKLQVSPKCHPGVGHYEVAAWITGFRATTVQYMTFFARITSTCNTGIDKLEEDMVRIYPNPAVNELIIDANGAPELNRAEIYDVLGNLVLSKLGDGSRDHMTFDLSHLQKGIYFAKLMDKSGKILLTKKFHKVD